MIGIFSGDVFVTGLVILTIALAADLEQARIAEEHELQFEEDR